MTLSCAPFIPIQRSWWIGPIAIFLFDALVLMKHSAATTVVAPRHCGRAVRHVHLSVGKDPTKEMTVSFASKWSEPGVEVPIAGVHVGTSPDRLDRFVGEQEPPVQYSSTMHRHEDQHYYYSPFQHHIAIDELEPSTTYYYVAVVGNRTLGIEHLQAQHIHFHDNVEAEEMLMHAEEELKEENEEGFRLRRLLRLVRRKLLDPYDGHNKPCYDQTTGVRSFTTAPLAADTRNMEHTPVTFAIIGDLGQFSHSQETLEHMRDHREGIDAVVLVGDLAYTSFDHRRWDTFFDFLDDFSIFDEVPLQVAIGNHDIDKQENGNEIFQAYDSRFRMPHVYPPELGIYDGPLGLLNLDHPPYPLPYEWGNAYYVFDYGPAKHLVLNAYASMEPGSKQYVWIKSELQSVNRDVTPWVLVTIHVPIYNSFTLHPIDQQIFAAREHLEPLFVEFQVNVVFTGHIHAYQRTANVAMEELIETGPIHITVGAGGRQCDAPFKSQEAEPWVIHRDASFYGYGRLHIFNATHAEWRWIPLSPSDDHDYNYVKGEEEIHLPQLDHDMVIIENQFYITQN